MKIGKEEFEQRLSRFKEVCRQAGVKQTHQRSEIFREVAQTGDHPDAEIVYRRVRKRMPTISLDTIYRTLWFLKELGLIHTLGSHRERTRFDANLDRHHHFVCIDCGLTVDFHSKEFDDLPLPDAVKSIGAVGSLRVEVRGICGECAARKAK